MPDSGLTRYTGHAMMPLHRAATPTPTIQAATGEDAMNVSTWTVALASLMLFGCATAGPTRPPSVDVTGKWVGDFSGSWGAVGAIMTLQQK